jgi:flagellar hook protein FlgE
MLRSMFAAVSGLRAHQTMMDVVGNNISNVNTSGYKASRTTFQDALNQVIRGSSAVQEERAGTNPMQVGLGAQVASIDGVLTQGSIQLTGRNTDLAIQGEGFFVLEAGGQQLYSRAGAFNLDAAGSLVGPGGARVMGWRPDATGAIDTQQPLQPLTLPMGQVIQPVETQNVTLGGNLPADAAVGAIVNTSITVYDQQGTAFSLRATFTKTAADAWDMQMYQDATALGAVTPITFDPSTGVPTPGSVATAVPPAGVWDGDGIQINFDEAGAELKQFAGATTAEARQQDGSELGFLRGFDVGADGMVTGRFSNGLTKALGAVALATFNNPSGLQRQGENMFVGTLNSGQALISMPGAGDAGMLTPGALEMSNVDMAQEFTNLIVAQRGFQANARSITAADEILSDIVNLKR